MKEPRVEGLCCLSRLFPGMHATCCPGTVSQVPGFGRAFLPAGFGVCLFWFAVNLAAAIKLVSVSALTTPTLLFLKERTVHLTLRYKVV